ncbi:MAG: hypothetical protein AB7S26_34535 [Sandaracinaceae bacterium]
MRKRHGKARSMMLTRAERTVMGAIDGRYGPTVKRWMAELEAAGAPHRSCAELLAWTLAVEGDADGDDPTWDRLDLRYFLFYALGAHVIVGVLEVPVPVLFDQLAEAMRRFIDDGVIERTRGEARLAQMGELRDPFIACYDEARPEWDAGRTQRRELALSPRWRAERRELRGRRRAAHVAPSTVGETPPNRLTRRMARACARKKAPKRRPAMERPACERRGRRVA